jgi:tRNA-specific 2-thiouridylase
LTFLERYTGQSSIPGAFLDQKGNIVGTHKGAAGYTLGQRKGLGLAMGEPVYVTGKDMAANTVTVGPNEALFRRELIARDLNWMTVETITAPLQCKAKARSRMIEQPATISPLEDGKVKVVFDEPQRAITPGQAVVFYDGDLVIGGGTIQEAL